MTMKAFSKKRAGKIFGGTLAAVAALAVLTGCTASLGPAGAPQADNTPIPPVSTTQENAPAESTQPVSPEPAPNTGQESANTGQNSGEVIRIDCDDDAVNDDLLVIDQPGTYEILDDDCDLIVIEADGVKISLDEADDIEINANDVVVEAHELDDVRISGDNNTVTTHELDDVIVSGSNNTVTWTDDDDVDVRDSGSNNTINRQ